jgi:hypothetical protein
MVGGAVVACKRTWNTGTFKRELATIMLAFLGVVSLAYVVLLFILGLSAASDPAKINAIGSAFGAMYGTLATMVLSFAGLAFGLDSWAKQIKGPTP